MFTNKYKWPNIIKNYKKNFKKIKKLKSYLIKFIKNSTIKKKNYLANYKLDNNNHQLIIIIIYNKCIFFVYNKMCKVLI